MHIQTRNVNTAFKTLVKMFHEGHADDSGEKIAVRRPYSNPNGSGYTLTIEEPVLITYSHPRERVLFNKARDCNPFMHVYEALWMLAGREDVAPLVYYAKQFQQYSDDGLTLNGAYGYRWRQHNPDTASNYHEVDQLEILIDHLKSKPESRRAVLNMWNVEQDLLKIDTSRDVCCNLEVMFSIREVEIGEPSIIVDQANPSRHNTMHTIKRYLDMTVTNRSNDLIWGCLGANYVHFTFLLEYMAAQIGVEVGVYNHFTNNLHVYDWNWKPDEWLAEYYVEGKELYDPYVSMELYNKLNPHLFKSVPLIQDPIRFDQELPHFVDKHTGDDQDFIRHPYKFEEPFFHTVAQPMLIAHRCYKQGSYSSAISCANEIEDDAWKVVCLQWLSKRIKK